MYLDGVTIICSVGFHPTYWPLLQPLWSAGRARTIDIVSSELALMETLIGPLKSGDAAVLAAYERALTGADFHLLPITEPILREAALLRAKAPRPCTPDAIHAATAIAHGCAQFLTNDHGFRNVPGLPVVILSDPVTP